LNSSFTEEVRRKRNDADRMFRANKEFHFTVYRAANMPVLLRLIENMWLQIGPMLHFSLKFRGWERTSEFAPDCHENLIKALRHHDARSAREALEADIMNAGDLVLRVGDLPD
jgi:DNA-binding GntR family transcriptional regulator